MILLGSAGASSSTSPSGNCCPLGFAVPNISPSCTAMVDCVSVPKPVLPWWRKRIQFVMSTTSSCERGGFWLCRTNIAVVKPGDFGALGDQRQHGVEGRGRRPGQAAHLLDHGDQRIDLHRAAALEVLQHRGFVRADLARTLDAPLDIDAEIDAKSFGDG